MGSPKEQPQPLAIRDAFVARTQEYAPNQFWTDPKHFDPTSLINYDYSNHIWGCAPFLEIHLTRRPLSREEIELVQQVLRQTPTYAEYCRKETTEANAHRPQANMPLLDADAVINAYTNGLPAVPQLDPVVDELRSLGEKEFDLETSHRIARVVARGVGIIRGAESEEKMLKKFALSAVGEPGFEPGTNCV